ncbi:MAG: adenylyl-sulfate kinase [Chthoniobacter sp.]|nr:adenylyl-sulfate kinase [Chthoniobacter sp.]
MSSEQKNLFVSEGHVTTTQRWALAGHQGCVVWFTGLSGSGKSTISREVERELFERGLHAFLLDGDNLRRALNADLGFSPEDRAENIRRTAEVARLLAMSGQVTITAFISPYREDREKARAIAAASGCEFFEVFIDAPLAVCEQRDPKQLYRRARAGEIQQFTGIDAPYEAPETPDVHVRTAEFEVRECVAQIVDFLLPRVQLATAQV